MFNLKSNVYRLAVDLNACRRFTMTVTMFTNSIADIKRTQSRLTKNGNTM